MFFLIYTEKDNVVSNFCGLVKVFTAFHNVGCSCKHDYFLFVYQANTLKSSTDETLVDTDMFALLKPR